MKKLFNTLGLSAKEGEVLNILFQHESLRVAEIAKKSHLNRTTAYGILNTLTEKGLVSSNIKHGIHEYQSIEPGILPSYIERQKTLLDERKKEVENILPQLTKIRSQGSALPKVYFFEGLDGMKQAWEDTLVNNKGKLLEEFTGPDAMYDEMEQEEYINYYVNKRKKLGIVSHTIAPNTKWAKFMVQKDPESLRLTKLMPSEYTLATEVVLYDNKVGLFSFSKEKPVAIIIEDDNISQTFKTIYRYVDKTLEEK